MDEVRAKRKQFDGLRRLSQEALAQIDAWYDVELTFTSNATDGNSLTRQETSLVLEQGITVLGKPLKDHQEAVDHLEALRFVRELVEQDHSVTDADVCDIHRLVVGSTLKAGAGVYRQDPQCVPGSMAEYHDPLMIPALMKEFGQWLSGVKPSAETAIEAHLRLISIHPFTHGNGRTARLLMNLMLLKDGYPPLIVRPEHRTAYFQGIAKYQLHGVITHYQAFMHECLNASLDECFRFLE